MSGQKLVDISPLLENINETKNDLATQALKWETYDQYFNLLAKMRVLTMLEEIVQTLPTVEEKAMKPIKGDDTEGKIGGSYYCPSCGIEVDYKFCSNCGQKLDWGDNE